MYFEVLHWTRGLKPDLERLRSLRELPSPGSCTAPTSTGIICLLLLDTSDFSDRIARLKT